jgi:AcrR family transcriptional regulator
MTMKIPVNAGTAVLDRRVQRTRDALREAMMALMLENGWDGIDVQTLCDRANIGRSTFYQHYDNKEALLKASFAVLRDGLLAGAEVSTRQSGKLGFVAGLIAHVYEAQDVFRALIGRRSGNYVQDRFRELLVELVRAELPQKNWQTDAKAHYLGGALFELLAWWLGRNQQQKPHEIEELFHQWSEVVLLS